MAELQLKIDPKQIDQINRRLREVPKKLGDKAVKKGLREGEKVIQKEAKKNAPRKTGQTKKAIKVKALRKRKDSYAVDLQIGKGDYKGDQFYASFQEFGWHAGKRKLGDNRKWIEGKHFMERAYQSKSDQAAEVAVNTIVDGLEQAVREVSKWKEE
jgi:HK97 gp10 family phage protein